MVVKEPLVTEEQFVEFVHRDENYDRMFELINGEIVEVSPSRSGYSEIAVRISYEILRFCKEGGIPGHVTGEAGTYRVLTNVIAPDVSYKRTPTELEQYPDPVPPEFAVEVISPTEGKRAIARKRQIYLDAEILYWEVYVLGKRVDVYAPGEPMRSCGVEDTLDGGDVLPGFELPVRAIFAG